MLVLVYIETIWLLLVVRYAFKEELRCRRREHLGAVCKISKGCS